MAFVPNIINYKPFYIQTSSDGTAIDTTQWGLVAKVNPYPALPDAKDPYKNDWLDEDGEEEYVADMHYKPMEFSVSFFVKAFATQTDSAVKVLRSQIDGFFAKVRNGGFKIYDSYTGLGRQDVRYVGYKEDDFKQRDNWARLIFTVTFKANDPITRMKLNNGSIVTE